MRARARGREGEREREKRARASCVGVAAVRHGVVSRRSRRRVIRCLVSLVCVRHARLRRSPALRGLSSIVWRSRPRAGAAARRRGGGRRLRVCIRRDPAPFDHHPSRSRVSAPRACALLCALVRCSYTLFISLSPFRFSGLSIGCRLPRGRGLAGATVKIFWFRCAPLSIWRMSVSRSGRYKFLTEGAECASDTARGRAGSEARAPSAALSTSSTGAIGTGVEGEATLRSDRLLPIRRCSPEGRIDSACAHRSFTRAVCSWLTHRCRGPARRERQGKGRQRARQQDGSVEGASRQGRRL